MEHSLPRETGAFRERYRVRRAVANRGWKLTYHGGQTAVSINFRETGIAGRHTLHNIQLIETPYFDVITCIPLPLPAGSTRISIAIR